MCAVVFALAFAATPAVTHAAIPESERGALIALYKNAQGGAWTNNSGWLGPSGTECNWYGVACDEQRSHVSALNLYDNNLTGSIPPEIGNLPYLAYLYLDQNNLSGEIPGEIGSLSRLEVLDLSFNGLTGMIPKSLAALPTIHIFKLSDNLLGGEIPEELANLNAWFVTLSHNQLTGEIPAGIGAAFLDLSFNRLSGRIPENMYGGFIFLMANQLSGPIPAFSGVHVLGLSQNRLSGALPTSLGVPPLSMLALDGNHLTGEIPASFLQLVQPQFGTLDLRWNALWSNDPALVAALNKRHSWGVDFEDTQTVPPEGLGVGSPAGSSLVVSWSPILYQSDTGGYQVFVASQRRGPFTLAGTVPSKALGWYQVTGLQPGTTYYFYVCSSTLAHPFNPTDLMSPPSAVVSGTTLPW